MATLGHIKLRTGKPAKAEQLFQEVLTLWKQLIPEHWITFDMQTKLGEALLAQQEYNRAAPLMRDGYYGLKQREEEIPAPFRIRLKEVPERLVQLYKETNRPDDEAKWRQKLTEFEQSEAAKPPSAPEKK